MGAVLPTLASIADQVIFQDSSKTSDSDVTMIIRVIDATIVKTVRENMAPSMSFLRKSIFNFQRSPMGKRITKSDVSLCFVEKER